MNENCCCENCDCFECYEFPAIEIQIKHERQEYELEDNPIEG
jgi:hypothetical protein